MIDIYNSASFLLIASAYSSSKIYAIKPTDGSGDNTIVNSRNSTGSRINSSGSIEIIMPDIPRLNYLSGSTCPGFLFEPQRTNLLTYSNTFSNGVWTFSAAEVTASVITSPSGILDGWKLNEQTGTSPHSTRRNGNFGNLTSGSIHVYSAFVKSAERTAVAFETNLPNAYDYTIFNLLGTGSVISTQSTLTASISLVTNGWYKISVKGPATHNGAGYYGINMISGSSYAPSYAGEANKGIYIYGAQVEIGNDLTSYIPTVGSQYTRTADYALRIPTSSDPYNFTLFHAGTFNDTSNPVNGYLGQSICILSGSISDWKWLGFLGTTGIGQYNTSSGNFSYNNLSSPRVTPNVEHKMLIKLENNSTASWFVDGTKIGSIPFSIAGTWDYIALNGRSFNDASSNESPAQYRIVAVIPSALSDADCITLTT
jgi:hypothetical protein